MVRPFEEVERLRLKCMTYTEVEVEIYDLPRDYTGLKCRCNFVCGKIDGFDVLDVFFIEKITFF